MVISTYLPTIFTLCIFLLGNFTMFGHWAVRAAISSAAKGISLRPCETCVNSRRLWVRGTWYLPNSGAFTVLLAMNCHKILQSVFFTLEIFISGFATWQRYSGWTKNNSPNLSSLAKCFTNFKIHSPISENPKIIHQDIELFISIMFGVQWDFFLGHLFFGAPHVRKSFKGPALVCHAQKLRR